MRWLPAIVVLVASIAARAQDGPVATAWARYRGAEFDAALEVLADAEASAALSAASYPRALEIRALAAHALGRPDVARAALRTLAAVDPDYGLGPEAVPVLREQLDAFRRAGEQVELAVTTTRDDGALEVRVRVTRDPLGLVARVAVSARAAGTAEWRSDDEAIRVPLTSTGAVELFAEALGPAGIRLAARGSREDPLRVSVDDEDGSDGIGAGWWLALGGVAIVAAGVFVAILLVTDQNEGVTVRPSLSWD